MKHHPGLLVTLLSLALATGLLVAIAAGSQVSQGPAYSVAAVQARLADHPRDWLGRTVRVRGLAEACLAARGAPPLQSCSRGPAYLVDAGAAGASGVLPLAWGSQDGVLAFARGIPLVGGLLPPPPTPRWWTLATYRVQLQGTVCDVAPCYEARLLDAAL